ncbi:MAG: S41 family peptidase [Bdellovibrionaceae bacterium]|nr:S41 family peptidase [Pseudobdellovibrionaceae bacterium]
MKKLIIFVALIFSFYSYSRGLSCDQIYYIQQQFLKRHILYDKLTNSLRERVLDQFIKNLDGQKIYFLKSDIENIKKKNSRLFTDLKKRKCYGLYYIYNLYSKRVKERTVFAKDYLSNKFSFDKNLIYTRDPDLQKYPLSSKEANLRMKSYIQYQVANIFLFEKDLKKSINQVSYIINNIGKQIHSWKPQLNPREVRECNRKSKDSFIACKPTKWFSNYLNAYSQSLDSHSSYMDNEDLEEFNISMNLELEGIGASLSSRFGYTIVEKLVPGGVAARSKKIQIKDKILAVGQSKNKMINIFGERIEDVVSIIRGRRGTSVYLRISRPQKTGQNKVFIVKLIRDRINLKEDEAKITYHNINDNEGNKYKIGLLKVPSFYGSGFMGRSVTQDVKNLLISANSEKIKALVLDLSNNRGGSLEEAVNLSGLFFSVGNVVKQSERKNNKTYIFKDRDPRVFYSGPLVVLVNRLSASASEIVAGSLQDYARAVVVGGDHTFGKGSVQSVEILQNKMGALKTTVGLYFIPSGRSTQKEGVISDISFPSIFNIDQINEKSLDYVLPSKKVKSFKSSPREIFIKGARNWNPVSNSIIEKLRSQSKKRIAFDEDFIKIKKNLSEIQKKEKNQKKVTIAEVLEEKNKNDKETQKEEKLEIVEDEKKYFSRPDIKEALNIAKDLVVIKNTIGLKSFIEYNSLKPSLKVFIKNKNFYPLEVKVKDRYSQICLRKNKNGEIEKT